MSHLRRFIVGIDEVGRGALAGPVVVAAAMITCRPSEIANIKKLKDSKQLTATQREAWAAYFAAHPGIIFAVARVYPRQIEQRNISGAANLAALRAYRKLVSMQPNAMRSYEIFLDGGLFLGSKRRQEANLAHQHAKTVVKADEKIPAVAIASIIAKVHRDRFMVKLARHYPEYHFEAHKGYGTKIHQKALLKAGPSEVHRKTFI